MLQESDVRCDVEEKLCDHSGSDALMQCSVGVSLTSSPGVERFVMSRSSVCRSGDAADVWEQTSGTEVLFPEDLPGVSEIVTEAVGSLLSVELTSTVREEGDSTLDEV
jgi:hypothetical protein